MSCDKDFGYVTLTRGLTWERYDDLWQLTYVTMSETTLEDHPIILCEFLAGNKTLAKSSSIRAWVNCSRVRVNCSRVSVKLHLSCTVCEPLTDYKQGDPLKWWHDNARRYPFLGNMAKQFLSAPPTSVPSERLFSGLGNLYSEKRSKLNPEHAEMP